MGVGALGEIGFYAPRAQRNAITTLHSNLPSVRGERNGAAYWLRQILCVASGSTDEESLGHLGPEWLVQRKRHPVARQKRRPPAHAERGLARHDRAELLEQATRIGLRRRITHRGLAAQAPLRTERRLAVDRKPPGIGLRAQGQHPAEHAPSSPAVSCIAPASSAIYDAPTRLSKRSAAS